MEKKEELNETQQIQKELDKTMKERFGLLQRADMLLGAIQAFEYVLKMKKEIEENSDSTIENIEREKDELEL